MEVKTAVIAAAGFGSRFLPVAKNVPKEMLHIIDKPSIQYLVEECLDAGIEKIIIVVRKGTTLISDYFMKPADDVKELLDSQGKQERYASVEKVLSYKDKITIIEQDPNLPYGNGTPFYCAKGLLNPDEHYVFLFGDDMLIPADEKGGVRQMIDFYNIYEHDTDIAIAGVEMEKSVAMKWGACVRFKNFDEKSNSGVMDFQVEKPTEEQYVKNNLSPVVTYGRLILDYRVFDHLTPEATGKDNELWLQDAVAKMSQNGIVRVKVLNGQYSTTGDPEKFLRTMIYYYLKSDKYKEGARNFIKSLVL